MSNARTVGILGGGQLGRMLVEAANRMNVRINILDSGNAPAKQISNHDDHVTGSFQDAAAIKNLVKTSDLITVEIEHVDTHILEEISKEVEVQPSWKTLRIIQDKFAQKEHLTATGVAVAPYRQIKIPSEQALAEVGEAFGYPYMLKAKTQAYDGRGNFELRHKDDIAAALKALECRPLYAEKWAPFKKELAVMVVKTANDVYSYPTVETVHEDSICKLVYAPAMGVSSAVDAKAQQLARDAVAGFDGKGVFGVEMFLLPDDTVLVNEIAPRPHNSGHYTIEACRTSQYQVHLKALLDWPIHPGDLKLREPAIMLNILGGQASDSHLELADQANANPSTSLHLYGKAEARPGRKMGHITVTAPYMYKAEKLIEPLIESSNKTRATRQDIPRLALEEQTSSKPRCSPPVAITTGSESDQSRLLPCFDILQELGIPFEVSVTSAHRTPDHMSAFAKEAKSLGVKVIIAAAGGAAHLPGMIAANTSLPVIGVPIVLRGDGMDSVLSILNMPSGVPVATVAADRAANAALLAARIIATFDHDVDASLEQWIDNARAKSMESHWRTREEMACYRQ